MEQSPFKEVSASASDHDDPSMLCFTFRSFVLGILFTCIISAINQFYSFHTLQLSIDTILIQLLLYPIGHVMARILTIRTFQSFGKDYSFSFNPGPFSSKEHCIIVTMADTAKNVSLSTNAIAVIRVFYKHNISYATVGIMRKYLVWPEVMVWPGCLINCALFRVLHTTDDQETDQSLVNTSLWKISRWKFFLLSNDTILILQITGVNGLGFGSLELNWNSWVSFLDSPIVVPLWAQLNIFIGFVIIILIIAPIAYYSNLWNAKAFPIGSYQLFTREGYLYNISRILDSQANLNKSAYDAYGEIHLSILYLFNYAIQFATISAVLIYTVLYDGKRIYKQFQSSFKDVRNDIHAKLMTQYPEVYCSFAVSFVIEAMTCHFGYLISWQSRFLNIASVLILLLPSGILVALSNTTIGLNVLSKYIAGLIMPGNPIANIIYKTYGSLSHSQALSFLKNLKLGHYLKIPPRTIFLTQVLATIISGISNYVTDALSPVPGWILLQIYPNNKFVQFIHFPVLFSGLSYLTTSPADQYSSWFLIGFIFNYIFFHYGHARWKRYAYIFSAVMTCGAILGAFILFFLLENNNIRFPIWWGTGEPTGDGCPLANGNFSDNIPHFE